MVKRVNTDITRLTIDYINEAIKENFNNNNINAEDIIATVKNKNDEIVAIDFNTNNINNMLVSITDKIQNDMKNLNNLDSKYILKEGNVYYVPTGSVTNLPLLGNLGPKMPIKVFLKGSVVSNIKTDLKDYGINNVLLKVFVHIETKISVYLPYNSKENKIEIDVPIAMKIIQGGIPQVYGGLFSTSSPIKNS
jgi:sporulation protein YunB